MQSVGLTFHTASSEEIKGARVADVYFGRAMEVLRARDADRTPVHAELIFKSSDPGEWFVVAGIEEVAHLLEGTGVEMHTVPEGMICRPYEPVMTLTGPYGEFGEHETAILGLLCQASGVATAAARCRLAAGERQVTSFGARRIHPSITPMIERSAYIGGCDSVAVGLASDRFGIPSTGTIPHALVLILGSTPAAARAFDETIDPKVPRSILIDTFDDERFGALLAAEAIPETIHAVRLDTPGSRRGNFLELMREVRWELDTRGFEHVKIFASGGLGAEDILELNPYCDGYGVGGYIAAAPMVDYALDIVEVDGEPRSKRGKRSGRKHLVKLPDGGRKVIPAAEATPEGARDLLDPVDRLYAEPPSAEEIRQRVLSQLEGGWYEQ